MGGREQTLPLRAQILPFPVQSTPEAQLLADEALATRLQAEGEDDAQAELQIKEDEAIATQIKDDAAFAMQQHAELNAELLASRAARAQEERGDAELALQLQAQQWADALALRPVYIQEFKRTFHDYHYTDSEASAKLAGAQWILEDAIAAETKSRRAAQPSVHEPVHAPRQSVREPVRKRGVLRNRSRRSAGTHGGARGFRSRYPSIFAKRGTWSTTTEHLPLAMTEAF